MRTHFLRKLRGLALLAAFVVGSHEACAARALTVHAGAPKAGIIKTDCRDVTWRSNTTITITAQVSAPCRTQGPISVEVLQDNRVIVQGVHRALYLDTKPLPVSSPAFPAPSTRTQYRLKFRTQCQGTEEKLVGADDCEAP